MSNEKYKDMIHEIVEHYGFSAQLDQCIEECAELIQAINKFKRAAGNGQPVKTDSFYIFANFLEEIADVEVTLEQIKALIPEELKIIEDIKNKKVKMQIERIKEE